MIYKIFVDTHLHASQHSLCLTILFTTLPTKQLHSSFTRRCPRTYCYTHTHICMSLLTANLVYKITHISINYLNAVFVYCLFDHSRRDAIVTKHVNGSRKFPLRLDNRRHELIDPLISVTIIEVVELSLY